MTPLAKLQALHDSLINELVGISPDAVPAWLRDRELHLDILAQDASLAAAVRERAEQHRKGSRR